MNTWIKIIYHRIMYDNIFKNISIFHLHTHIEFTQKKKKQKL